MASPGFARTVRDSAPAWHRQWMVGLFSLLLAAAAGCDSSSPTAPAGPSIRLSVPDPAVAAVSSPDIACIELPVTVVNLRTDADGRLEAIFLSALVRDTDQVVAENRRPNPDFPILDTELPAGGTLVVPGGLCYPRDVSTAGLDLRVRVEVSLLPVGGGPFTAAAEARVTIVEEA